MRQQATTDNNSDMQEGKKEPFASVAKKQSWEQLQQLNYIKVKVNFHFPNQSLKTVVYKCNAKETFVRFRAALKQGFKLKEHEALFLYFNKKIVELKKTLAELRQNQQSDILVLDAATTDIF